MIALKQLITHLFSSQTEVMVILILGSDSSHLVSKSDDTGKGARVDTNEGCIQQ